VTLGQCFTIMMNSIPDTSKTFLYTYWLNCNKHWIGLSAAHYHTTTILRPFFRNHLGEPVPEENFWTLWRKGRLTEADKLTIRLGATQSGLTSAHLHHPPHIASAHWTTNLNNTVSDAIVTYYMGMWTNGNGITHTKKVTPQ